jgi:hypothetical protein
MAPRVDPFDPTWVRVSLTARADRVLAGGDADAERSALFEELVPWATQLVERTVRRLPPHADRNEVHSRVLLAVWEATSRIDWDRVTAWPSLLKQRIRGARMDAARSDDVLSRRDRAAYRRVQRDLATAEQTTGRSLTSAERRRIVAAQLPNDPSLFDVLHGLDQMCALGSEAEDLEVLVVDDCDPEGSVLERARLDALHRWLTDGVPVSLAKQLTAWARRDRAGDTLPKRLARRVEPYRSALVEQIDFASDSEPVA